MIGYLDDFIALQGCYGWAFDPESREEAVSVYLFDDRQKLGVVKADQYREDVKLAGIGNGYHGFVATLDSMPSLARIREGSKIRACFDQEGRLELSNCPFIITPALYEIWSLRVLHRQRPAEPAGTYTLNNAVVIPTRWANEECQKFYWPALLMGGIYTGQGRLDPRASLARGYGLIQHAPWTLQDPPVSHIDQTCIYGGVLHDHFGHFLTESLARSSHFQEFRDAPIIYTHADHTLHDPWDLPTFVKDVFEVLEVPLERIHIIQDITTVRNLVVPSIGLRLFDYADSRHLAFLESQAAKHMPAEGKARYVRKIYLSRSLIPPSTKGSMIWAENIFERYLGREGFEIVHPETLDINQQFQLVLSADYLVGFVGSAFHSLLFSYRKPRKVIYLHRNKVQGISRIYSAIDDAKGLDTRYLDFVEDVAGGASLVNFEGISEVLLEMGLVTNTLTYWKTLYRTYLLQGSFFKILQNELSDLTISDIRMLARQSRGLPGSTCLVPDNPALKHLFRWS
jgi:hypothetical protein